MLPAAIRPNLVEEFLNDREVHDSDLRDLCPEMESPKLQEVRDACADLVRGEEEDSNDKVERKDEQSVAKVGKDNEKCRTFPISSGRCNRALSQV